MAEQPTTAPTASDTEGWDFFLAHAGPDLPLAKNLQKVLEPPARVFLDADDLELGRNWDEDLEKATQSSLIFLVIVTASAQNAHYLRDEIADAIQRVRDEDKYTKRIVPIYVNSAGVPSYVPYGLRRKHGLIVPDGADMSEAGRRLLEALEEMKRGEQRKDREVEKKREAVNNLASGDKPVVIAGLLEVTRAFHPLLKALLALLALVTVLIFIAFFFLLFRGDADGSSSDVALVAVYVLSALWAALLGSIIFVVKLSLNYARQIALGRINGG